MLKNRSFIDIILFRLGFRFRLTLYLAYWENIRIVGGRSHFFPPGAFRTLKEIDA